MGYAVGVTNSLKIHWEDVDAGTLAVADTECMAFLAVVAAAADTSPVAVAVAV